MKRIIFLVTISVTLHSCYTTKITPVKPILDSWIGKSDNDLILAKGKPQKLDTYKDGYILTYLNPNVYSSIPYKTDFFVNAQHIVYAYNSTLPDKVEKVKDKKKTTWAIIGSTIAGAAALLLGLSAGQ